MHWLSPDAGRLLPGLGTGQDMQTALQARVGQGEVVRAMPGRTTFRDAAGVYVKLHDGVGWIEVLKNLISLRLPVLGATNEFVAARRLAAAGLRTLEPVAFGVAGGSLARQRSFLVTREIHYRMDLEALAAAWRSAPPAAAERLALVRAVAAVARTMHRAGVNHRDFYLCHLLLAAAAGPRPDPADLTLIDLHRAQCRQRVPRRWLVKDLGGLWFSAMDLGLRRSELLRFVAAYTGERPALVLRRDRRFWAAVQRRAQRLYREGERKGTVQGGAA